MNRLTSLLIANLTHVTPCFSTGLWSLYTPHPLQRMEGPSPHCQSQCGAFDPTWLAKPQPHELSR
jgi:hypothetical protein